MITLRELAAADVPAVRRVYSGASVRFTHDRPYTTGQAHDRVSRALAAAREKPRVRWDFGVVHGWDLVGTISLRLREPGLGTLGYILREDTWGRGYATHAARQVVAFAFTLAGLDCLEAKHHPGNPASGRVLVKAGFTRVGTAGLPHTDGVVVPYPVYGFHRALWACGRTGPEGRH